MVSFDVREEQLKNFPTVDVGEQSARMEK